MSFFNLFVIFKYKNKQHNKGEQHEQERKTNRINQTDYLGN